MKRVEKSGELIEKAKETFYTINNNINTHELPAGKRAETTWNTEDIKMLKEEIFSQKEIIETQLEVALIQKDEISEKKKEITDSIRYARRIQSALLPKEDLFKKIFTDYFIFYKPKDIVSGDFYWISVKGNKTIVAATDCTGHGVPGAFMSIMGMVFLNEIVNNQGILQPNKILDNLNRRIISSLGQNRKKGETSDRMDIALVSIDLGNYSLQYAGAFNSLFIIRNNCLHEIKGDRMLIGVFNRKKKSFTNHEIEIKTNDSIYLFSDGYIDQFGWRSDKKFNMNNFREFLLSIQNVPMKAQKLLLENNLINWMGDMDQIDDILVIGIKI